MPVLVTIFNTRLRMLEHLILNQETPDALQVKADLQEQLRRIPRDAQHMANAEFKINKPTLVQEACASLN